MIKYNPLDTGKMIKYNLFTGAITFNENHGGSLHPIKYDQKLYRKPNCIRQVFATSK